MFGGREGKQRKHEVAYGAGKEKARKTGAVEGFGDAMASLILPDSVGTKEYQSYRQGYKEHHREAKRPVPPPKDITPPDASEKAWYSLCNVSDFIPDEIVDHYKAALFAKGNQVAFVVGLSKFTPHACPRCGQRANLRSIFSVASDTLSVAGKGIWERALTSHFSSPKRSILASGLVEA
jgi:hypothetical protein